MKKKFIISILFFFFTSICFSQEETKKEAPKEIPEAAIFTSKQSVTIDGKKIDLTATAGTVQLRDENNKPIANFGFTSWTYERIKRKYHHGILRGRAHDVHPQTFN